MIVNLFADLECSVNECSFWTMDLGLLNFNIFSTANAYIVVIILPLVLRIECWIYDDVIKWKHFPRYWSFVRGIRRSPVNSPHKGQ